MFEIRKLDQAVIPTWDDLVYSQPSGTIFHTMKWLKMIEENQGLHANYLGIFQDKDIVGLLPLMMKKFMFVKVAASPFVVEDTPYMGPILNPFNLGEFLPALDIYLKSNGIQYVRIISRDDYNLIDRVHSFDFIKKQTHLIDLFLPEHQLWQNMEGRCRTAIRKAQKKGVAALIKADRRYIEEYYSMIEAVYHDQGKPCPNPRQLYYDMWDAFGQKNALFLSAEYRGETIAGAIIILDRDRAYYINGTSRKEFRSLNASNLIQWEAIRLAKEKGIRTYDLVGSDIPRLATFKKSFGGTLTAHSCIEKARSKWVYLLREKYPRYKQIMGRFLSR